MILGSLAFALLPVQTQAQAETDGLQAASDLTPLGLSARGWRMAAQPLSMGTPTSDPQGKQIRASAFVITRSAQAAGQGRDISQGALLVDGWHNGATRLGVFVMSQSGRALSGYGGGGYFAARWGGTQISASIGRGTLNLGDGGAKRHYSQTQSQISAQTLVPLGRATLTPFATLTSLQSSRTSGTQVQENTGTVGGTIAYPIALHGLELRPYVTLTSDVMRRRDTLGAQQERRDGRVSLGVTSIGANGDVALEMEGGRLSFGFKDYILRVNYTISF